MVAIIDQNADLNRDGIVDSDDFSLLRGDEPAAEPAGQISAPASASGTDNIVGYAGYIFNAEIHGGGLYTVRHRHYAPELGRWLSRDPIGYVDGMSLYEYVRSNALVYTDLFGLCASCDSQTILDQEDDPHSPPIDDCGDTICDSLIKDPAIQGRIDDVYQACGCLPRIRCEECPEGQCGREYKLLLERCSRIVICVDSDGKHPEGCGNPKTTLIHELVHARQRCSCKRHAGCRVSICKELEAYEADGSCWWAIGEARERCLCEAACRSASRNCFMQPCMQRCSELQKAGACVNGCYEPRRLREHERK